MKSDELTKMYIEVLANFLLLNKNFKYEHPLDVYALFLYALNKGYLSKDKEFVRTPCKIEDYEHMPLTIMSGKGVCRNISTMLNNIFNIFQIENELTLLYSNPPEVKVLNMMGDSRSILEKKEEIIRYSYLKERLEDNLKKLNEYGENSYLSFSNLPKNRNKFIEYLGNHVVNTATFENTTYVVDPTNGETLKPSDCNKLYLINYRNLPYHITTPFGRKEDVDKLLEKLKHTNTTFDEDEERIFGVIQECGEKQELFEGFYEENKKLYKDISRGLKKELKKKK